MTAAMFGFPPAVEMSPPILVVAEDFGVVVDCFVVVVVGFVIGVVGFVVGVVGFVVVVVGFRVVVGLADAGTKVPVFTVDSIVVLTLSKQFLTASDIFLIAPVCNN